MKREWQGTQNDKLVGKYLDSRSVQMAEYQLEINLNWIVTQTSNMELNINIETLIWNAQNMKKKNAASSSIADVDEVQYHSLRYALLRSAQRARSNSTYLRSLAWSITT